VTVQHPLRLWLLAVVVGLVLAVAPRALPAEVPGQSQVLHVFVREGCPHCAAAEDYLQELQQAHPALEVRLHQVGTDPRALAELQTISRRAGIRAPGVPTFVIHDTVLVGFDGPAGVGRQLQELVQREQQEQTSKGLIRAGPWGPISVDRLGMPFSPWPWGCRMASTPVRCGCCCSSCRCWCTGGTAGAWPWWLAPLCW
jgi:glutaredoxin